MFKNLSLFILVIISSLGIAQTPDGFYFQAVASHSDGSAIGNQEVSVMISLMQEGLDPEVRYCEIHDVNTNNLGQFQVLIGDGFCASGSMDYVQWSKGGIDLKIEIDPDGGANYQELGKTALASVPYAMSAKSAEGLNSSDVLLLSSDNDIQLKFQQIFEISKGNQTAIYVNENGKIGIGTNELDDDSRKDIEMGVNKRLWGYSNEWHLDMSGVYNLQAMDEYSKPAILWYSPTKQRQAAIVAHLESHVNGTHNHWSIETSDSDGELQTRFEIPLSQDAPTIQTHTAHFKVADTYDFITTGRIHAYGSNKVAFGDKDWENAGLFGNAKWEFYRSSSTASFLIHQGDGSKDAEFILKSGGIQWSINQNGKFNILHNNQQTLTITQDGAVGIGTENPESKLHVEGDISISAGHSYKTSGADFAEYFPASEELQTGDIAGINLENGFLRKYREGDELIGVVSGNAGFVGNVTKDAKNNMVLVGLIGQLEFNSKQAIVKDGYVFTSDMKKIGVLLANGKVFLGTR